MTKTRLVRVTATGRTQRVPEHFLAHPVLGEPFEELEHADEQLPAGPPSEEWTIPQLRAYAERIPHAVDLTGARSKRAVLDAIEASMSNNGSGNNADAGNQ